MNPIERVSVLGCGVIGASWAALFLANGYEVDAHDPVADGLDRLKRHVRSTWPTLEALGYREPPDWRRLRWHDDPIDAVTEADFVQESVPERIALKRALFAAVEPHLQPHAVLASSASGLMLNEMQTGWEDPARFILGHPFNPPHLIPLVELLANERTDDDVLPVAEAFYQGLGKVTIRVRREVPAHVANRLQAALWREAIHLVVEGVASVRDVDKAVWAGPGLRWAAMGPHRLFHLGAGEGGLEEFCRRYGDSFHRWWEDLGGVSLTPEVIEQLARGVAEPVVDAEGEEASRAREAHAAAAAHRDALIVAMVRATGVLRLGDE